VFFHVLLTLKQLTEIKKILLVDQVARTILDVFGFWLFLLCRFVLAYVAGIKFLVQTLLFLIKKILSKIFLSGELWLEISAIIFAS
jgi:hypothetical protein